MRDSFRKPKAKRPDGPPSKRRFVWVWHPARGVVRFEEETFLFMRRFHLHEAEHRERDRDEILRLARADEIPDPVPS